MSEWKLSVEEIEQNISQLQQELKDQEAIYISSSDIYLSEYVPLANCFRYYLSGFTGSTAEMLITKNNAYLFLDGRYHEQGAKERHPSVTPVNVAFGQTLIKALMEQVEQAAIKVLYYIASRTAVKVYEQLTTVTTLLPFDEERLKSLINYNYSPELKTPYLLTADITGHSSADKLEAIFADDFKTAYFVNALDQVAWITNCRGFHAPYQSFFYAKALVTKHKIYLFSDQSYSWPRELNQSGVVEMLSFADIEPVVTTLSSNAEVYKIYIDKGAMTVDNFHSLDSVCGITLEEGTLNIFQKVKNRVELSQMQDAFDRSNRAIINTLRWTVQERAKREMNELELWKQANDFYKAEGAIDLSFATIAAIDENASVIHFSAPSRDKVVEKNSLFLLDSGAYYHSGYATDTTRTICVGDTPNHKLKHYYTLVLKGLLQAEMAVFPSRTVGAQIDALARAAMRKEGLDYAHGTGHGVGINVHESGFSISTRSTVELYENLVGSIEPGIYIPDLGGIRLENIVQVVKHPTYLDMLCFRPLTWIGYDFNLIELELLDHSEREYLIAYEQECLRRGTSFNWQQSDLYTV